MQRRVTDAEEGDMDGEEGEVDAEEGDMNAEEGDKDAEIQSAIESKLSAMLILRKRLFAKASKNIEEAQNRYKKNYDHKRSKPEVSYCLNCT